MLLASAEVLLLALLRAAELGRPEASRWPCNTGGFVNIVMHRPYYCTPLKVRR